MCRPFWIGLKVNLPDELPTDLSNPHGTGAGDVSKAVTGEVATRVIELRVVEDVEEFSPKLERFAFLDRDALLYPEISVVDAWAMEEASIGRTKRATLSARLARAIETAWSRGESTLVKVSVTAWTARIQNSNRPDQVGHVGGRTATKRGVSHTLLHLDWEAWSEASNALDLPALRQPFRKALKGPVKRKGPNVADYEIMVHIGWR